MSGRLYLLMMVWVVLQALWPASVVVIQLWVVEAFCLTPVIACLFFVASVLSMLEKQMLLSLTPQRSPGVSLRSTGNV
jgi:hypothetical protein